jgi:ABC-type branched-subunit amino acid transport system substrate-binding protein
VVTTADRDARTAWRAVRAVLAARRARAPALQLALPAGTPDDARAAAGVARTDPRAVLVLAGARDAARIVRALRAAGFGGRIVGGASVGRRPFLEQAGAAAEGVVFPRLFDPGSPDARAFARAYEERWGSPPDHLAAHAHDAVLLVVDALRRAGLNRARIVDAIAAVSPWRGALGIVSWDPTGRCARPVGLGFWHGGVHRAIPAGAVRRPGAGAGTLQERGDRASARHEEAPPRETR